MEEMTLKRLKEKIARAERLVRECYGQLNTAGGHITEEHLDAISFAAETLNVVRTAVVILESRERRKR